MLHHLHTRNTVLNLKIMMKGQRVIEYYPSDIAQAFDITEGVVLEVLMSHLTHIEVGEDGSTCLVTSRVTKFKQGIHEFTLGKGIPLVVRSADGRLG